MDFIYKSFSDVDWIHLAQDIVQMRAVINTYFNYTRN